MQFIPLTPTTVLRDLTKNLKLSDVQSILSANRLPWAKDVGTNFRQLCSDIISEVKEDVPYLRKARVLNTFVDCDDVFEKASLAGPDTWKVISELGTFPDMLKVPQTIKLPSSFNIFGSAKRISSSIYEKVMDQLMNPPHIINPESFVKSSPQQGIGVDGPTPSGGTAMQFFKIPWGDITLVSSIDGSSIQLPGYPEELSDSRKANYTQMPELLYQYEPWQLYTSSGPRSNTYNFDVHRHMWTGDHRDGKANELIRFCESLCYPEFNGSIVNVPLATLYVKGSSYIRGVVTDVTTSWDGPIADDGWYLHFRLSITIVEVSEDVLNYSSVKSKSLLG